MKKSLLLSGLLFFSSIYSAENIASNEDPTEIKKIGRQISGWADLQVGTSPSKSTDEILFGNYHGALELNLHTQANSLHTIQVHFYQICEKGCDDGAHEAFSYLYGRAKYLNDYSKWFAQIGIASLGYREHCYLIINKEGDAHNTCESAHEVAFPFRLGMTFGNFVGLTTEFNGMIGAHDQIIGIQAGLAMGVF